MMFAIQCPSCQHKNTPGERFCSFCGVTLDLKPCPNCGKVDLVTSKICAGCGEVFPHIDLAPVSDSNKADNPSGGDTQGIESSPKRRPVYTNVIQSTDAGNKSPPSRALPLILVALVAGGIPMLWMNRDRMPLPKAWKIQKAYPDNSSSQPNNAPLQSPASTVPQAPENSDSLKDAKVKERTTKLESSEELGTAKTSDQPARTAGKRQREPAKPAVGAQGGLQTRECTEAVAAVGLCEKTQIKKQD